MADMESPMSVSNLISSPLIQKCQSIYTLLYLTVQKEQTISLDWTSMMKGKGLR